MKAILSGQKKRYAVTGSVCAGAAVILILFRKPLFPFFLALGISMLLEKPVSFLQDRTKLPRGLIGITMILGIVGIIGFFLSVLASKAIQEFREFASALPGAFSGWSERADAFLSDLPLSNPSGAKAIREAFDTVVSGLLTSLSETIPAKIGEMLSAFPNLLLSSAVFFLSCFYLTADLPKLRGVIGKMLPETWLAPIRLIFHDGLGAVARYLRALFVLMLLTFSGLTVGFLILGVSYPLVAAFLIAIVDLLPILGVGTVLVPWAVFQLLTGNTYLGFGLLILFGAVSFVRQLLEPKIVGASLGLPPLVTLLSVWSGWNLFGVGGMIVFPLLVITVWSILTNRNTITRVP